MCVEQEKRESLFLLLFFFFVFVNANIKLTTVLYCLANAHGKSNK